MVKDRSLDNEIPAPLLRKYNDLTRQSNRRIAVLTGISKDKVKRIIRESWRVLNPIEPSPWITWILNKKYKTGIYAMPH